MHQNAEKTCAPKKSPAASFRNRPPFIVKVKRNPSSFCLHCRTDGVKPFREKYVHQQRLTRYQTPNSKMNSRRLAKETIKMNFPIVNIIEKSSKITIFGRTVLGCMDEIFLNSTIVSEISAKSNCS